MNYIKKTLKIIIVVFWAAVMVMIYQRSYMVAPAVGLQQQYLDTSIETKEEWAGIYLMNKKIGYAHTAIRRIEEGYQITEDIFLDMTIMNVPQKMTTRVNAVTDRNLALNVFSFRLKSGIISFIAYGTVEEGKMSISINAGGKKQKRGFVLDDVPMLSNSLKYYVLSEGLTEGKTFNRTFFDPMTMSNRMIRVDVVGREKITVHGEEYECYKVRESFGGVKLHAWIDDNGNTVREESPMGLVIVKEDRDTAVTAHWGEKPDVLDATAIPVDTAFSKEHISYLKMKIEGVSLEDFDCNDERQKVNGRIIEIRQENVTSDDTYQLPFNGQGMEKYLEPEPFIQSDNKKIIAYTSHILRGEKDAQKAVRKLERQVYKTITKKPTMSIPNALEVLSTKQGDCNEHAVLFTALCRAAGIPAKLCAGIVYMNGSFYYHAWAEVYLGRWITVDPTLHQFPADVTHVKFIEGDLEQQIRILQMVGNIDIDILEYR